MSDKLTLDRIKTIHPLLRVELEKDYIECNNLLGNGVRLRFSYVYRSEEEQNELFKKRPKVTNAKGGQSIHNYGLAFDIVLLYDKNGDGIFETASWDMVKDGDGDGFSDWMEVVKFFKAKGWTWGGDWKSFKDGPHFEKPFGNTWRTLQTKKILIDNGFKYPEL